MLWRRRRFLASLTALLVGVAVIACACGAGTGSGATPASADEHACCGTSQPAGSDAPAVPASEHDGCPHCAATTAVPATAADHTPAPALAPCAVLPDMLAASGCGRIASFAEFSPLPVSPPDLLSVTCALLL